MLMVNAVAFYSVYSYRETYAMMGMRAAFWSLKQMTEAHLKQEKLAFPLCIRTHAPAWLSKCAAPPLCNSRASFSLQWDRRHNLWHASSS